MPPACLISRAGSIEKKNKMLIVTQQKEIKRLKRLSYFYMITTIILLIITIIK